MRLMRRMRNLVVRGLLVPFARRRFQDDERGQALFLGIFLIPVMLILVISVYNAGEVLAQRMQTQNINDAAAYSGAVWEARGYNFVAYCNRAIAAHLITIVQLTSHYSFCKLIRIVGDVLQYVPYVGPVIKTITTIYFTIGQYMFNYGVPAASLIADLYGAVELPFLYACMIIAPLAMEDVTEASDPDLTSGFEGNFFQLGLFVLNGLSYKGTWQNGDLTQMAGVARETARRFDSPEIPFSPYPFTAERGFERSFFPPEWIKYTPPTVPSLPWHRGYGMFTDQSPHPYFNFFGGGPTAGTKDIEAGDQLWQRVPELDIPPWGDEMIMGDWMYAWEVGEQIHTWASDANGFDVSFDFPQPEGGNYKVKSLYDGVPRFTDLKDNLRRTYQESEDKNEWPSVYSFTFKPADRMRTVNFLNLNPASKMIDAGLGDGIYTIARARLYYRNPTKENEKANFWNPYWGAQLRPVDEDLGFLTSIPFIGTYLNVLNH